MQPNRQLQKRSRQYVPENLPPPFYTKMTRSVFKALGAFAVAILVLILLTAVGVMFL